MIFKSGVKVRGVSPELILGIIVAENILKQHQTDPVVFTSLADGKHRSGSLHYVGDAVDIRVHNLPPEYEDRKNIVNSIREALTDEYDIIYEHHGTPNAHIHLEYQPKRL